MRPRATPLGLRADPCPTSVTWRWPPGTAVGQHALLTTAGLLIVAASSSSCGRPRQSRKRSRRTATPTTRPRRHPRRSPPPKTPADDRRQRTAPPNHTTGQQHHAVLQQEEGRRRRHDRRWRPGPDRRRHRRIVHRSVAAQQQINVGNLDVHVAPADASQGWSDGKTVTFNTVGPTGSSFHTPAVNTLITNPGNVKADAIWVNASADLGPDAAASAAVPRQAAGHDHVSGPAGLRRLAQRSYRQRAAGHWPAGTSTATTTSRPSTTSRQATAWTTRPRAAP